MAQFLKSIIKVSMKAANIARVCREEKHLFQLLVQEKNETEKNPNIVQDFKTLADVLIQETIKTDIGAEFPNLASHIKGEESNTFCNTLGDKITVAVQNSEADTAALLSQVLNGDTTAGKLLAAEVHRSVLVDYNALNVDCIPEDLIFPMDHFGIWIDPIDSTFEYINGTEEPPSLKDIHSKGLQCVTVLIGVFDRRTGEPVLGVVNQPFITKNETEWLGNCYWGVCFEGKNYFSHKLDESNQQKVVILSSNENENLKKRLVESGYLVVEAAGAGYKCLTVALGQADVYLLSRGTTYRWDICGPHALLRAQHGGIIRYVPATQGSIQEISYFEAEEECECEGITRWCNKDGFIAYRNVKFLGEIVHFLKES